MYALIRVFTLLFPGRASPAYDVLLVLSAITMVVGLVAALAQSDFRRVLSFNLVAHIGFTTVGLALWTNAAVAGSILYMLHHMLVITSLFLVSGWLLRQRHTTDLAALGGLYHAQPWVAALAMVPLFSLAGIPPLSGFIAKLAIVSAALDDRRYWLTAVALAVSLLTMLSMARLWNAAFWKPSPTEAARAPIAGIVTAPAAVLALLTLGLTAAAGAAVLALLTLGLTAAAGPVFDLASRAAEQLLHPHEYMRAVLGTP